MKSTLTTNQNTSEAYTLLSTVLDASGHICITGLKSGHPVHQFFNPGAYQAACDKAKDLDARGYDSYFCTSTFKTVANRLAKNVSGVKTLKLDLDINRPCMPQRGDKFNSQREAVLALLRFCTETGLPAPVTVDSGYGVHAYWPLTTALSESFGKALAEKFKTVCLAHGLHADPTVTADTARILRVPGTRNFKDPGNPKTVKLKGSIRKYDTDTIITIVETAYGQKNGLFNLKTKVPVLPNAETLPAHLRNMPVDDLTHVLAGRRPQHFSLILQRSLSHNGCAQLSKIFTEQAVMDEPRWRAGLSIAQFCTDRDEAIHTISRGYPGYLPAETDRKASETKGPYTCSTFRHNWPKECAGCPFTGKITSPIQLGANDAATAATIPTIWAQPEPLPDQLLPVAAFDMNLLPAALQPWARDIVERMQCPADFVAITIISALGTLIGRRVGIRPKAFDDWTEYCNFWTCIVGRPGVMKSPAMAAALAPLNALGAKASQRHADEQATFDIEAQLQAMRLDAQKKQLAKTLVKDPHAAIHIDPITEPEAPILKRYLVNDASVEALLDICIENPQGVCAYRDELVALLKSLEREGQESARGFYLAGWNGNHGHTADRIGRGRNMHAEAVCLSVLGSTQPGRIGEYLRAAAGGGAGDDGLI